MPETVLLYYAFFAAFCLLTLFKGVEWGMYLYVGMYFLAPWERWYGPWLPEIQWMQIVAGIALIAFFFQFARFREQKVFQSPVMVALIFYVAMLLVFIPFAIWPDLHLFVVDKMVKVLVILLLMYKVIDSREKFEYLLWAYLLGSFYLGSVARDMGRHGGGRLGNIGTIDSKDINDLSAAMLIGIPALLFYAMEGKRIWIRALALLALAYVLNTIILGGSRGAFLGLIVAASAYLYFSVVVIPRSGKYKLKIVAAVAAGIGLFVYLADDTFWDRQATIRGAQEAGVADRDGDGGRTVIWGAAWQLAKDNPFGLGAHGFTLKSTEILPPEYLPGGAGTLRSVHSTFFEALTAYGFAGAALFALLFVLGFRGVRQAQRQLKAAGDTYGLLLGSALLSGFVGYLIACVFLTRNYHDATFYLLIYLALFASIYRRPATAPVSAEVAPTSSAKAPLLLRPGARPPARPVTRPGFAATPANGQANRSASVAKRTPQAGNVAKR